MQEGDSYARERAETWSPLDHSGSHKAASQEWLPLEPLSEFGSHTVSQEARGAPSRGKPRQDPPWRQPRGKTMVSLVNSHTNATSTRWHLWEIDLRFAPGLPPGWIISPDARAHPTNLLSRSTQIVLFIDHRLVRTHVITEMIQRTIFAPWVISHPVPDGLRSTVLD